MEDVTEMMLVAESLASHANQLEAKHRERSEKLMDHITKLEAQISTLKAKK
jgi:hypothetical protein